MTFQYKVLDEKYPVIVVKKNNKNTYIKVREDLTIYVTTNYFATKHYIKSILDNEYDFLKKSIAKVKKHRKEDNDFYYLGKKYDIMLLSSDRVEVDGNIIKALDNNALDKWLKKETVNIFNERLILNYNLFEEKIPFPKLKIRKMKTRWGVCNKRDISITLNSKLIRYSIEEIDYVIIHELSHLVHFDHSRKFWETVEKYMPNYKKAVKVLKE